jgi:hypothetical protein
MNGVLLSGGAYYGRGIYPVILPPHVRKKAWVISAGPSGGGGLEVYGALSCGRINTIFLPMTPANWILQYCEADGPVRVVNSGRTTTISLPHPLTPPDAVMKFDFARPPLPPDKAHKYILLKGLIQEDGSVAELQVYRGVDPELDETARQAFGLWWFLPATRADKPVTVQVLLGIPASK